MFRVSQFMHELVAPTPPGPRRDPPGPVVIWNLIRRCNLACKHCYSISTDKDFAGELSTDEVFAVMDDLKAFRVPVLILSGGEPLLRPDIFTIAERAKAKGFYTALSTNGTLIDPVMADRIKAIGFDYVGISIDGIGATHDRFRALDGAFDASVAGIRALVEREVKVGLRFTMTMDNAGELPQVMALAEAEGVGKFYFSHLNYAGRGNKNRLDDASVQATRRAMLTLFDTAWSHVEAGRQREFVTGNNDADGPYFLSWVRSRLPDKVAHIAAKLVQWGGNASGVNVANIDNVGDVHPDTMWWNHTIGNVRQRAFSDIWPDTSDSLMAGLKRHPRPVEGRCAACVHLAACNGNTRVRAQRVTGNVWAEDPGCYLTDEEVGI
ncbi:heme d1 biosynthesis radical SAM protein NirJ [Paramagnetospirillum marisnigri]|uniref:Pre-heme d1 synthase n=1 Tax=Paramagnetospirillum marisnigri TaxID=1285242 RepID=A0A178MSA5_9PROT|nr:heme d1 biosynthesis radical SAM protein NirJ [Paramagnetospirillum marisnigri]OAN51081.1 heme d1 biosynthesis radical SAM protein NirJ [Paramagnetospirillum marisnigri]